MCHKHVLYVQADHAKIADGTGKSKQQKGIAEDETELIGLNAIADKKNSQRSVTVINKNRNYPTKILLRMNRFYRICKCSFYALYANGKQRNQQQQ